MRIISNFKDCYDYVGHNSGENGDTGYREKIYVRNAALKTAAYALEEICEDRLGTDWSGGWGRGLYLKQRYVSK
ncbi:MAG: hypothetical protein LBP79_05125 [Clostridiales bacterium]|jgi:hypothetical protein|nr:hypothetical protein [Clostridiales bacterium]